MRQINTVSELRAACKTLRADNETIGLVMTMGNLHDGHLALVDKAKELADHVIATIFVNPMQFDKADDLAAYPRTLREDSEKLERAGVEIVFVPSNEEIYPNGADGNAKITVPGFVDRLEGQSRPGHFVGVATVVNKVFNMVNPDFSIFGEKDIQQLVMIQKMVKDLNMPIEVIGLPTKREADGLAMSSRNGYLTKEQRAIAPSFNAILSDLVRKIQNKNDDFRQLESDAMQSLVDAGFGRDYVEVCRYEDFEPAKKGDENLIVVAAAWLGKARLIDNIRVPR